MAREDYFTKARRLLGEGRLRVTSILPDAIHAMCYGDSGEMYLLAWDRAAGWFCDCEAKGRCSHMQALMLVVSVPRN